ncbi:MAG: HDIG domain-containing protein [Bacteroidaceae bacterium]|nr:HDIG domain-containing protein [Bacteroidaceae bacterium]
MDLFSIIDKYYPQDNELRHILLVHGRKVADLSLEMAARHPELQLDLTFIEEAALLHDIGIFLTDAPRIHCYGTAPYICHGYYGAELLRMEGLFKHARVCERHTGVGLTKELIMDSGWPLPFMDFIPQTLEEQLICFADKFYSKTRYLEKARTMQQVVDSMEKISQEAVRKVKEWALIFG